MQTTAGTLPRSSNELDAAETRSQRRWPPIVFCIAVYLVLAMTVLRFRFVGPRSHERAAPDAPFTFGGWPGLPLPSLARSQRFFAFNYPFGQNFRRSRGSKLLSVSASCRSQSRLVGLWLGMSRSVWRWPHRRCPCSWSSPMVDVGAAAFVGGLLYGFSSYGLLYARGVYLFISSLPPIIFLVLHEILVRQRWRPMTAGIVLAVLCTFQFFVSTEILASTLLIGAIATILLIAANRRLLIADWRYAAAAFGWATLGTVVLLTFLFCIPSRPSTSMDNVSTWRRLTVSPIEPKLSIDPSKVVPLTSNSLQGAPYLGVTCIWDCL